MSEVLKIVWTSIHLKDCMSLHKLVLSEQDVYSSWELGLIYVGEEKVLNQLLGT